MLWARLIQKLSRCIWGEREVPVKQVFWCSNRETWTFSCYQDMEVQDLSKSCWGSNSILQANLPLLFTHSWYVHTLWFRHIPNSRKSPRLGIPMEASACSKTIIVLIEVLDVPALFSQIFSPHSWHVGLLWVAQPFPINCSREFWNWGLGLSTKLTGDMEKLKRSNTFKGLGWRQLDFFLSQQEVF